MNEFDIKRAMHTIDGLRAERDRLQDFAERVTSDLRRETAHVNTLAAKIAGVEFQSSSLLAERNHAL